MNARHFPCPVRTIAVGMFWLCVGAAISGLPCPAGEERVAAYPSVEDILKLHAWFQQPHDALPDGGLVGVDQIDAYEEHASFVYVAGRSPSRPAAEADAEGHDAPPPTLLRRLVFLKPDTFVLEDRIRLDTGTSPKWLTLSDATPGIDAGKAKVNGGTRQRVWGWVAPGATDSKQAKVVVKSSVPQTDGSFRVLRAFRVGEAGFQADDVNTVPSGAVTVKVDERVFELDLAGAAGAAKIAVRSAGGEPVLPSRLLPAGILPHGSGGAALLERWDSAYRQGRRPGWDVGRPSSQLKKAIDSGEVRPGRALEFGCGTGTNAVYLATQGFEVTAIDVAPTALARAEEKARQAGVKVRWLLADVLAPPPDLGTFDFVFDRGCYHGVRRSNAKEYVAALARLSHPGTQVLIMAGNANEERQSGPPRVREQELRGDFSNAFDFRRLDTVRFDAADPNQQGALAWSILLVRKGK